MELNMVLKLAIPENHVVRPFISVDYQESHPETYQGVKVEYMGEEKTFFSNDFKKDITDALQTYPNPQFSSSVHSYMREAGIEL